MWRNRKNIAELEAGLLSRAAALPDGKLVDTDFPPAPSSAGAFEGIVWARAASSRSILDSIPPDATQGKVGDCWFLSVATLVARRPDLVRRVLVAEHPEAGFYIFSFFKEGSWVLVFVDDFLPSLGGKSLFAFSSSGYFFQLLEKAYAKMRGSYFALSMGSLAYAFTDLTGEPTATEDVTARVWEEAKRSLVEKWLVSASPYYPQLATGQEVGNTGLYANHAYALTSMERVGEERLFRLRNPWGHLEWKGAWADGDTTRWTTPESGKLGHAFADDGDFWIGLPDFRRFFTKIVVCRLYQDEVNSKWQVSEVRGGWRAGSAGGSPNHPSWAQNPRYRIQITGPTSPEKRAAPIFVSLSQEDIEWRERAARTPRRHYFSIGLAIFDSARGIHAQTSSFVNSRDVSIEFSAEAGRTYLLVPATFSPGEESEFLLRAFCPVPFQMFPQK